MKRSVCFIVVLMIVLCTCPASFAEGAESTAPAAYIGDTEIQPYATRSVYLNGELQIIYTCPVKKDDVFVTFHASDNLTSAKVKIETQDPTTGDWDDASEWEVIKLSKTVTFNLTQSARYRVWVAKEKDYHPNGTCTFYISASP